MNYCEGVRVVLVAGMVAGAMASGLGARATPADPSVVTAGSKWFVHVDLDALRASKIGAFAMANKGALDIKADDLRSINKLLQMDLEKDLRAVTVFAASPDAGDGDETIAVLTLPVEIEKQLERLAQQQPGFEKAKENDFAYYTWADGEETKAIVVLPSKAGGELRSVVIAPDATTLREAAATISGKKPGVEAGSALLRTKPAAGSILFASALELPAGEDQDDEVASRVVRQSEGGTLDIGESNGELYGEVVMRARTEKDAADIVQVGNGLLALGRMMSSEQPEGQRLGELASAVTIVADGRNAVARGRYPAEKAIAALRSMVGGADDDHHNGGGRRHGKHHKEGERKQEGEKTKY